MYKCFSINSGKPHSVMIAAIIQDCNIDNNDDSEYYYRTIRNNFYRVYPKYQYKRAKNSIIKAIDNGFYYSELRDKKYYCIKRI